VLVAGPRASQRKCLLREVHAAQEILEAGAGHGKEDNHLLGCKLLNRKKLSMCVFDRPAKLMLAQLTPN
jgi:hypothetical protein